MGRLVHLTSRASAVLFLPIRAVFGRFHRRRHTLAEGLLESDQQLPPLPEPWAEDDRWYAEGQCAASERQRDLYAAGGVSAQAALNAFTERFELLRQAQGLGGNDGRKLC